MTTIDIEWTSDWIWRSRQVTVNDFAYFRKEFEAGAGLVSARLFVSAHNYAQVFVNGTRVNGYVSPASTNPWRRKLYTENDILPLLREGANCITADAHYLGGGGQNYVDALPAFRLELHLAYADGRKQVVKTDTSWDALAEEDMPHEAGTPYQQNRRISAIERFDARKWDASWRLPGPHGAGRTVKAELARPECGEWPMARQRIPEGAVAAELALRKLDGPADEDRPQIFDAGMIVSGWPRFRLKGAAGAVVRLRYSEDLDERGRVKHNVCNERSDHYYDEYVMRGDPVEEWQPAFSYKAFRYVEVTGYPHPIGPDELVVCDAHTGIVPEGSFRCSDDHLNALYDACIRTQLNNVLGQVVDCPHREQAQYLADTDLQAETLLYNFDALSVIEKTLDDFADMQLEDGSFPFVAPTNDRGEFAIRIPEWDLHYATLLWKAYEASGDPAVLAQRYETLRRTVGHYVGLIDASAGLVPLHKGWHISDWPYPSVEHEGEFLTVQQIKLWQALRIAGDAAELLGRGGDSAMYRGQADRLREAVLGRLYDPKLRRFRDSSGSSRTHQGVTALALYAGIVPEEDRAAALDFVAGSEWECRTVLSLPLLRTLFDNGRAREAFALLDRRTYPGWGHMIAQGSRTMWEGWDDIESHSHAWNGYPARLLQEYVAGIRAQAPGFARAVIRPYMPESLRFARATVRTARGLLSAGWERLDGGRIRLTAVVPEGVAARAEVALPSGTFAAELAPGAQEFEL